MVLKFNRVIRRKFLQSLPGVDHEIRKVKKYWSRNISIYIGGKTIKKSREMITIIFSILTLRIKEGLGASRVLTVVYFFI